jgi:hypothetical protein
VEQEHRQFKRAVDQALRARRSRDFADRAAYARFLQNLVRQRNLRRQVRWLGERAALGGHCQRVLPPTSHLHHRPRHRIEHYSLSMQRR